MEEYIKSQDGVNKKYHRETLLNYGLNRWALNKASSIGKTSELIRKCSPFTLQEWEEFYFKNAEISNIFLNNYNIKNIGEKINKIKQNYIFSDVSIDMINDNDKFNLIVVDTVSKLLIDNKENDYNAYVKMEKGNTLLLEKMNDILQHLNKGEQSILYLFGHL